MINKLVSRVIGSSSERRLLQATNKGTKRTNEDDTTPTITTTNHQLDLLLAQELSKLSMKDRQEAEFDIHGVADVISETPELIETSLRDLGHEIERKLSTNCGEESPETTQLRQSYQKAQAQNPNFVKSETLGLKFLRAERFHVEEAAERMFRFFDLKEKLFGEEKLTKEITIQDLTPDDRECLKSGICQLLPLPDRAGRVVLFWNACLRGNSPIVSRMRTSFYMYMAASRDINCQKKGMVIVLMNLGLKGNIHDLQASDKLPAMLACYPIRFDAYHSCVDPLTAEQKNAMTAVMVARTGSRVRVRARRHEGSFEEIKLKLMCFGIPFDSEGRVFPMTSEDNNHLENHLRWYQLRVEEDLKMERVTKSESPRAEKVSSPSSSGEVYQVGDIVQTPTPIDILLGRSKICQSFVGNARYYHFVSQQADRYENTPKQDKTKVASEIVQLIKETGSRFLKETKEGWLVVDDKVAREKVSNAFRDLRKKAKAGPPITNDTKPKAKRQSRSLRQEGEVSAISADDSSRNSTENQKRTRPDKASSTSNIPLEIKECEELEIPDEGWNFSAEALDDIDYSDDLLMGEIANVDWIVPNGTTNPNRAYISDSEDTGGQ